MGGNGRTLVPPFILAAVLNKTAARVLAEWTPARGLMGFGIPGSRIDGTPPPPKPAEVMLLEASFEVWQRLHDHGIAVIPWPSEIDEAAGLAFARCSGVRSLFWYETRLNATAAMIASRLQMAAEIVATMPRDGGVRVRSWS